MGRSGGSGGGGVCDGGADGEGAYNLALRTTAMAGAHIDASDDRDATGDTSPADAADGVATSAPTPGNAPADTTAPPA